MTKRPDTRIGCILLAAGGSARLGRPKQLLLYKGKTLIRRSAETIRQTRYSPIIVVLGSHAAEVREEIEDLPIQTVVNDSWEKGLSSSIAAGLNLLIQLAPDVSAALVTLCDQPLIGAAELDAFAEKFLRSDAAIVAAGYENTVGVPALFSSAMFADLLKLEGDKGARTLIRDSPGKVLTVPLPAAAIDIDTQADINLLT